MMKMQGHQQPSGQEVSQDSLSLSTASQLLFDSPTDSSISILEAQPELIPSLDISCQKAIRIRHTLAFFAPREIHKRKRI